MNQGNAELQGITSSLPKGPNFVSMSRYPITQLGRILLSQTPSCICKFITTIFPLMPLVIFSLTLQLIGKCKLRIQMFFYRLIHIKP